MARKKISIIIKSCSVGSMAKELTFKIQIFKLIENLLSYSLLSVPKYKIVDFCHGIFALIHIWGFFDVQSIRGHNIFFIFYVVKANYFCLLVKSAIFHIVSLKNRRNFTRILKNLQKLQYKYGLRLKENKLIVIFNFTYLLYIVISASLRVYVRIVWRLDTVWEVIQTTIFVVNSFYSFYIQHFVILLFCNYSIFFLQFLRHVDKLFKRNFKYSAWNTERNDNFLMERYDDIYKIFKLISDSFSFIFLLNAVSTFEELVFILFYNMVYSENEKLEFIPTDWKMMNSNWSLLCLIDTVAAVSFAEFIKKEVRGK